MNEQLRHPVRQVVEFLVNAKYQELEILTKGVRLSARDMATAIADYGRRLVMPPDGGLSLIDSVQVRGAPLPTWSLVVPLWTLEEGRSDLSVELTLSRGDKDDWVVELDNIHVL
jgi:hypothetical protein